MDPRYIVAAGIAAAIAVALVLVLVLRKKPSPAPAIVSTSPGPALPAVGARTIDDPLEYLVERGPDGARLTVTDMLTARRHDWPLPDGWEVSDSVLLPTGRVLQTFSFRPWGPFNAANGDGGQILEVGADGFVRGLMTRDGGKPYMQHFVGQGIGGTGWVFFGIDAPTGQWRELVALLSGEPSADARPATLSAAFTRYRRENVGFLFHPAGWQLVDCIVSEHYDRETIDASQAMERSYFGRGFGLLRWEAWNRTPETPADLSDRYHPVDYSEAPGPGWFLEDARTYTNVVPCEPTAVPAMS